MRDPDLEPDADLEPTDRPGVAGLSRRRLLLGAGAGAVFVLTGCGSSGPNDQGDEGAAATNTSGGGVTTPSATFEPVACVLTPELTAGPYHLDGHLARSDITEGRPGTPLEFHVRVLALPGCTPLEGAAVDIWHCDTGGEYSGFNGNSLEATAAGGTNDKRFLRGVQLTDGDGVAAFTTICPGWYQGRTVHIHLQVLEGGTFDTTYTGGHVAHVGQAFFDESVTAELLAADPYRDHSGTRTTNEQDSIYAQAGPGTTTALTAQGTGYVGQLTCLVDPAATPPPPP